MLVTTTFWFCFAAVMIAVHWALPPRVRDLWLIACGAALLGVLSPLSLGVLTSFAAAVYWASNSGGRGAARADTRRLMAVGAAILLVLGWFKYSLAVMPDAVYIEKLMATGWTTALLPRGTMFLIPLGLSYYAFRCLHFLIERYKGTIPAHSLRDFLNYLFFMPVLFAGPIHRFGDFHRDIRRHRFDRDRFMGGFERVLYGYVKIGFLANFLIMDVCHVRVMWVEAAGYESLAAYLTMLVKGFNTYFLFAGYSSVAIGVGMMLGYKVMENFNWPFIRKNISEFWKSWHISLSSWCRDYIYMGVISVSRSPVLAAVASMLVLGLWHEFSLRYVAWGVYHGLGIAIWQQFQKIKPRLPQVQNALALKGLHVASVLLTFHFVMAGFLIVRYDSFAEVFDMYRKIFLFWL